MKNRLLLGITLLLSSATMVAAPKADYATTIDFVHDFLDPEKKPHQPMKYWYTQLVLLMHRHPGFGKFAEDLKKTAFEMRNPKMVGLTFLQNQDKFNDTKVKAYIKTFVDCHGVDKLTEIIKMRMNAKPPTP